ncbi:Copiatype Polyprotein [Phytophthora palmivora]|uniref:Copiatype Polyprotein n=1 Tax=Phytophthora palmivora TaxID=4796 RepID=A0A2P4X9P6_9STRA|nr:Copiatype Polyprotein [Phytophthora palmivora]
MDSSNVAPNYAYASMTIIECLQVVLLYVGDILCATSNEEFKNRMFNQGPLSIYLGVEVEQSDGSTKLHQTHYREGIIGKFDFGAAYPSRIPMETKLRLTVTDVDQSEKKLDYGKTFPYRELVGSLMYLATCTKPDIAKYVQHPTQQHIGAAKRALRYLCGTKSTGIEYSSTIMTHEANQFVFEGFCDSDWGNDPDTRRSVTGFVHCVDGGAVSWTSSRQAFVAQSTAEAEYVADWLRTEFRLGIDNQAACVIGIDPMFRRRMHHIELRWHHVRDQVAKKTVTMHKVKSALNLSDLLMKPLASDRLEILG